jgi:hypothetical protein
LQAGRLHSLLRFQATGALALPSIPTLRLSPAGPSQVEQREKEARQKAKAEAHLYCSVRLARDADMAAQVG